MKRIFGLSFVIILTGIFFLTGCKTTKIEPVKVTVDINNTGYNPETLAINPPTEVTWVNKDTEAHSVTSGVPEHIKFDSGVIQPGKQFQFEFTTDMLGAFKYHSFVNGDSSLTGTIVVNEK